MNELLIAIGLVFVLEGLVFAVFPEEWKKMVATAQKMPATELRKIGIGAMALGVFLVWLIR
ncbi:MAG: hypothetical protein ACJAVO_002567 [Parvibaculaceae bacterium]|jgi:uncharacterized protein YjeT (DUF2065 family)|nr:DUF2065 domain-containing protein [Parvibaculaceae bacterium]|tara:strand:- start:420 stop:602 length:183 start_codon:yes stop_codon:yes gene_type:complete